MNLSRIIDHLDFLKLQFLVRDGQSVSELLRVTQGNLRVIQFLRLNDGEHHSVGGLKGESTVAEKPLTRGIRRRTTDTCDMRHCTHTACIRCGQG